MSIESILTIDDFAFVTKKFRNSMKAYKKNFQSSYSEKGKRVDHRKVKSCKKNSCHH